MTSSGQMNILADALIVKSLLAEPRLYKKAGFISDFKTMVENHFKSEIDENNPTASVIRLLAPGIIFAAFKAMGFGKLGTLIGFLISVFHIDVDALLNPLLDKVKEMVMSGKPISPSQITEAADMAAQQYSGASADDGQVAYSSIDLIYHAKIVRLALIDFEYQNMRLMKTDFDYSKSNLYKMADRATATAKSANLLSRIIGFIITIILSAAGFLVLGDAARTILNAPPGGPEATGPVTTQTKFQPKEASPIPRSISMINNPENIESILIQFAKDAYNGLDGKENLISSTPGFRAVKNRVVWFNADHPGSSNISIPPEFTSKKQLTDNFIDDVAKASQ